MDMLVYIERKEENAELRELLVLEPVSLMIEKSKLRLFGHAECEDDTDLVKSME